MARGTRKKNKVRALRVDYTNAAINLGIDPVQIFQDFTPGELNDLLVKNRRKEDSK